MKSKKERTGIAESAIDKLKIGIERTHKPTILEAYSMVEDEDFSWNDLDVIFMQWDSLVDEANEIVYS